MITAKVITDSIGREAPRLLTYELVYPRFIHSEFMTHRVFSRNASSSRAIPVKKMITDIIQDTAFPVEWRMNESGMQGWTAAPPEIADEAYRLWLRARDNAIEIARDMDALGLHKQHINRVLEPFQHIRVVVTGTEWLNFDGLRTHGDAEPSIQALAKAMVAAREASTPVQLATGEWHTPYAGPEVYEEADRFLVSGDQNLIKKFGLTSPTDIAKRVSAARCARTSYKTFDGKVSTITDDLKLYEKLMGAHPVHASPVEHQATPDFYLTRGKRWMEPELHGNLRGWIQFRKTIPGENLETLPAVTEAAA